MIWYILIGLAWAIAVLPPGGFEIRPHPDGSPPSHWDLARDGFDLLCQFIWFAVTWPHGVFVTLLDIHDAIEGGEDDCGKHD